MRIRLTTAALGLLFMGSGALAQDYAGYGPWYYGLDLGTSLSTGVDSQVNVFAEPSLHDLKIGPVVRGTIGRRIGDFIRADIDVTWRNMGIRSVSLDSLTVLTPAPVVVSTMPVVFPGVGDIGAFGASGNVWGTFALGPLRPFLGGGAGVMRVDLDSDVANSLLVESDDIVFAWNAGGGVSLPLGNDDTVQMSIWYRYTDVGTANFSASFTDPTLGTFTAQSEIDMTLHEVMLGFRQFF